MKTLIRVACALACAGIVHFIWLAAFLLTVGWNSGILLALRWLFAPPMTAAGFAVGILIGERLTGVPRAGFWRTLPWPLVACAVGAGAVYWFGPMFIGAAMFALGTLSVIVREVTYHTRRAR